MRACSSEPESRHMPAKHPILGLSLNLCRNIFLGIIIKIMENFENFYGDQTKEYLYITKMRKKDFRGIYNQIFFHISEYYY